jgi:hypothetical protein
MKQNLIDYVKVYKNSISDVDCNKIIEELNSCEWQNNYFYDAALDKKINVSGEKEVDMSFDIIPSNELLMNTVWLTIKQYISELEFSWFSKWNGYSRIRFNRYHNNKEISLHYDCIHSLFDGNIKGIPTLSVVGVLNNDHEGGEFIMFGDKKIELTKGDIMIFPSTFLYPHEVKPVTSGTRHSFVSWVW